MSSPFDLFPDVRSLAISGLYGLPKNIGKITINQYIEIVPRCPELDEIYNPLIGQFFNPPSHYLIGIARDDRYWQISRDLSEPNQALSSLILVHQAMCIYDCHPYKLGPIYGFNSSGSPIPLQLFTPAFSGVQWELSDELFRQKYNQFFASQRIQPLDAGFTSFLNRFAQAYTTVKDKRWMLSAVKFTSGINRSYVYESVLEFSISMESLLNRSKDSIGLQLRLYMSLLIGRTYEQRKMIQKDIKDFYTLRSKIAHGENASFSDENLKLIERIGTYIAKALKYTCGRNMKNDVFEELDYLSLLGYPKLSKDKVICIVRDSELAQLIQNCHQIHSQDFKAYMAEDDDGDKELNFEFQVNGDWIGPYPADGYIWLLESLQGISRYTVSYSQDDNGEFVIVLTSRLTE